MSGPTDFIKRCVAAGNVFWSYHSNMRLGQHAITRQDVLQSVEHCEIIEDYADDTPLPSCPCLAKDSQGEPIHYVVAVDEAGQNIRFVTVYRPDTNKWESDFRRRRRQ